MSYIGDVNGLGDIGSIESKAGSGSLVAAASHRRLNSKDVQKHIKKNGGNGKVMDHSLLQLRPLSNFANNYEFDFLLTSRSTVSLTSVVNCEIEEFLAVNDLMIADKVGLHIYIIEPTDGSILARRSFTDFFSGIKEDAEIVYNGTLEGRTENNVFMQSISTRNFKRTPQGIENALLNTSEIDPSWGMIDITNFQLAGAAANKFKLTLPTFQGLALAPSFPFAGKTLAVGLRLDGILLKEFRSNLK